MGSGSTEAWACVSEWKTRSSMVGAMGDSCDSAGVTATLWYEVNRVQLAMESLQQIGNMANIAQKTNTQFCS